MVDFEKTLGPRAEGIVKKYPVKRSAVLPLLHLVQEHQRHIDAHAISWVAEKLGLQPINVWEVVTFYPSLKETPMGKLHIRVCKTLSCMLAGAEKTGAALSAELNCKMGETRADGEVSIEWVECLACCDKAPVVMVNDKLYEKVTPEKAAGIVKEAKGEK